MDFEAINNQIKKNELMNIEMNGFSVEQATESIMQELNIEPLINISSNYQIKCDSDAKQALSMSLQARKLKKTLETSRVKIVRPHLDFQRAINSIVKEYTKKLLEIENSLKTKLDAWLQLQATFEPNFSEMMIEVEDGKISTKFEWKFSVEDINKVPSNYLTLDEMKIKQSIKMGVREIPGINIFEEKKTTMRIKND